MSDSLCKTVEEIKALATEQGLVCFLPKEDELFLDLDVPFEEADWKTDVSLLFNWNNGVVFSYPTLMTRSKNGRAHGYIKLFDSVTDIERIALQAALGSDPKKEALSIFRMKLDPTSYSSALFETLEEAKKVEKWRKSFEGELL